MAPSTPLILGQWPAPLTVRLVHGDGATLLATSTNDAGVAVAWPAVPTLHFADISGTAAQSFVATVAGETATWVLSRAQVDALWTALAVKRANGLGCAWLTLPDGDDGRATHGGSVTWAEQHQGSSSAQTVATFTVQGPQGLPGTTTWTGITDKPATFAPTAHAHAQSEVTNLVADLAAKASTSSLAAHTGDLANPHAVTKAQVGLANVDNTADTAKPVSTLQQAAIDGKAATAHIHDDRYYTEAETDAAITAALLTSDVGYPQTPHTYEPWSGSSSGAAMSASRVSYCRAKGAGTITKVMIAITAQAGNIDIGVYRNTGSGSAARPGARLASTGSIACPVVGEAALTLSASVTVRPGDWFAIVTDNAAFAAQRVLGGTYTNGQSFVTVQTATFPLPATAAPTGGNGNCYLIVGVA